MKGYDTGHPGLCVAWWIRARWGWGTCTVDCQPVGWSLLYGRLAQKSSKRRKIVLHIILRSGRRASQVPQTQKDLCNKHSKLVGSNKIDAFFRSAFKRFVWGAAKRLSWRANDVAISRSFLFYHYFSPKLCLIRCRSFKIERAWVNSTHVSAAVALLSLAPKFASQCRFRQQNHLLRYNQLKTYHGMNK